MQRVLEYRIFLNPIFFKSGKSDKTDKPRAKGSVDTEDELMKPLEFASKDDYQLTQAMNLLKAWQIMKRN